MIKLDNITVIKDEKLIFDNFNIEFKLGESYAIVGKSGSGKSTLLNTIAGFEKPKNGTIFYNNSEIKFNKNFYRYCLGYLFQNYGLVDNKSVNENLDIGLKFKLMTKSEKEKLKEDYIKEFNVNVTKSRKISTLSGGEQQRVSLIRLILKSPSIILADEPTGALDKENGFFIFSKLLSLIDKDKVLIVATHDIDIAHQCDNIINL
ncbi:ATP-binding cassette domain-containing protein [Macrococcoides caseolyticum]|uniref:ATP-binding cassette domain-containing protein n=1 Tax=Macrococcus psychrotolerans TaxID=3039389 RepID=A0AAT9P754_9STAP|nr:MULTISPECIES: ATP-binding cassette domain-containing protein [Macrococcus]PKE62214.1 bacteriocin ABC transporter ATP-binding protein [Macrococcus caseolyticus]QYA34204.1 ATP-binding cassette domain-containing protein [Macrococcus sp. 19Msa1099]QYA39006.1 ATP-binding cassette domain-containing protein [Macrococcus caseolyticus]QYA77717.1 ATP-binding cassette domain-containing protein [Macrococcus caseolyticus]TDM27046.1 ATP-binding cassette domain-containing protein [Macrococcus caseolyticus